MHARIATVTEEGELKRLTDLAWQSIKHSLVTALSVGFLPIKSTPIASGLRFTEWRWGRDFRRQRPREFALSDWCRLRA